MPEIITIFFDCNGHPGDLTFDSLMPDARKRCHDAFEDLLDYLHERHISYYVKDVTHDECECEETQFINSGDIQRYGFD